MSSPPKQMPQPAPPPPVRETGADIAIVKEEERRKQAARRGYSDTIQPERTLLTQPAAAPKKTLLG